MALVQLGGGVHDIRGSIGGTVFSRNRFGNYIRARITPVNPQSSRQSVVRSAVQFLAQRWSNTLTQLQRDGWEVYADNIVRVNKLGAQIKLTGFNHYIRSNVGRSQAFATIIDVPPVILTLAPGDPAFVVTGSEATQLISVVFDDTLDWANQDNGHMLVFMSQPKTTGTNFIGGPWRFAGSIDGNSTTPPTSPVTFAVPFPIAENQALASRARISEEDGRLSDHFRDDFAGAA